MKVYKELEKDKDIIKNYNKKVLTNLFEEGMFVFKDTGWSSEENTEFEVSPSVGANSYFVNNNDFSVSFISNEDPTEFQEYMTWNSFMSAIGVNYDDVEETYPYIVNGEEINQAIVIQFNRDFFKQEIDYDNVFIAFSDQTGDSSDNIGAGTNFNLNTFMVLAPFFNRNKLNIGTQNTIVPQESYELRTSDNDEFLSFDDDGGSINIDWNKGDISGVIGEFFPKLGTMVIFPELFPASYEDIANTITNAQDRSESALNAIMYIAGYGVDSQSQEIVFVRMNNGEFNYPTNPTAFRKLSGKRTYLREVEDEELAYPTLIGLFNNQNECLATVSLSKAEQKSIVKELPFRIEINI